MSSSAYPPQYRHDAAYSAQHLAYLRAQQQPQARQPSQPSAAYYPSPESTSPSSDGSSPPYFQQSPTLYRPGPSSQQIVAHLQQRRPSSSQCSPTSPSSPKERQFFCMFPEHQGIVGFVRKADLKRHYDQVHNADSVQLLDCPEPRCHRKGHLAFGRKDKLVEHQREVHGADLPKRSSGPRR